MPQDMPTLEMVRLLHERSWIEQGYQQLKEELGVDHHEGRSWTGWYRHVLLVFLAFGYVTHLRLQEKNARYRPYGDKGCTLCRLRGKRILLEKYFAEVMQVWSVPSSFFSAMAAKATCLENALITRYPPSINQMLAEDAD